jgi:hypothetical protein
MTPKEIQAALRNAGFYAGGIDGDIGPETRKAISRFRRSQRLGSGTNPGPVTVGRLRRFLPANPAPVASQPPTTPPEPAPKPVIKAGSVQERMALLMRWLRDDFRLDGPSAAAIVGNWGHESGLNPRARGPAGDLGLAQWTGGRRRALHAYAGRHAQDVWALQTQYGFARQEMQGAYASAIRAVKRPGTLMSKVQRFERLYEAAGVKHYASRYSWALRAMKVA